MDNNSQIDNSDIKVFIRNKLEILDKSNLKYKHLINNKNSIITTNNMETSISFMDNDNAEYTSKTSLLGVFDLKNKIWLWAWSVPSFNLDETKDSRTILNYGLSLDINNSAAIHNYIKPHLINSRLYFENDIYIDIHLGLSLYIIKTAKFIYPRVKDTNIIVYYLIY